MAIKGKKKSQTRGSQGQRRPAAAPRPVYTGRRRDPWYKTTEGRLIGGMLVAVVVGVAIWLLADAQNKSRERTETRESLESYADTVRSFTNALGPVAEDMSLVEENPDVDALKKDAEKWSTDLSAAQAQIASVPAPDEAVVAGRLFEQSLTSFLSAARTYQSAADTEGDLRAELLAQATEEREQARALFETGVLALDAELQEVGGENSRLSLPAGTPPTPDPAASPGSTTIEIPSDAEGQGGGGGGQGGGGQGGGAGGGGGGDQGDGN
ncbi:MAG TPA: hypothetical protein VHF58_00015 [Solirubrobacterales bacterium]|nr:hypothetical protein [Solirubrobacterales bacterium]